MAFAVSTLSPIWQRRLERHGGKILLLLFFAFLAEKIVASVFFVPRDESVFALGFRFGGYVETLYRHGVYAFCMAEGCDRAARMPVLPLLYTAIAHATTNMLGVALVKDLLLSAIFLPCFYFLLKMQRRLHNLATGFWCVTGIVLCASVPVVKHAGHVTYEEAILFELLVLWGFAFLLSAILLSKPPEHVNEKYIFVAAIALSTVMFLAKSSMFALFALSVFVSAYYALRYRDGIVAIAVCLCIVAVAAWGVRNKAVAGRLTIMTSWDGTALYAGWNSEGLALYPNVSLDRLYNSSVAYTEEGIVVPISAKPLRKDFNDEWAYNDYYRARAVEWGKTHPFEAAQFVAKKLFVFFVGIRKVPYTISNDARPEFGRITIETLLTSVWLACGRLMEILMCGLCYVLWRRKDTRARFLVAAVFLANGGYAAPYIAGFAHERHITGYLVLVAVCVTILASEWFGRGKPAGAP